MVRGKERGRGINKRGREREREGDILIPGYVGLASDRWSTVERRWSLSNKLDSVGTGNYVIYHARAALPRVGQVGRQCRAEKRKRPWGEKQRTPIDEMTPLFRLANGGCRSLRPEHRETGSPRFFKGLASSPTFIFAMNEARYVSSTSDKQVDNPIKRRRQILLANLKSFFWHLKKKRGSTGFHLLEKRIQLHFFVRFVCGNNNEIVYIMTLIIM